ncbi:hypothetical protein ECANGB1_739 [Enterospora canceri]|uniref:Uncharacterized protein n=1 Tax=Enterospora canceri TaxID=1081671 RepID=A0A1Y1S7L1_9MICR|nr:hypothetical protein ECANGB1_739 [Enterospora canceri]
MKLEEKTIKQIKFIASTAGILLLFVMCILISWLLIKKGDGRKDKLAKVEDEIRPFTRKTTYRTKTTPKVPDEKTIPVPGALKYKMTKVGSKMNSVKEVELNFKIREDEKFKDRISNEIQEISEYGRKAGMGNESVVAKMYELRHGFLEENCLNMQTPGDLKIFKIIDNDLINILLSRRLDRFPFPFVVYRGDSVETYHAGVSKTEFLRFKATSQFVENDLKKIKDAAIAKIKKMEIKNLEPRDIKRILFGFHHMLRSLRQFGQGRMAEGMKRSLDNILSKIKKEYDDQDIVAEYEAIEKSKEHIKYSSTLSAIDEILEDG